MSITFNHTVVQLIDKYADARYLVDVFGLPVGAANHRSSRRGVYFHDPDGQAMELLTRAA